MLLLLLGASSGAVYGGNPASLPSVRIVQQNGNCTGVVKDLTGETVVGASVVVKGTTQGSITDLDGRFSLPDVRKGAVLRVSFVGYQTQEVTWNGEPLTFENKKGDMDELAALAEKIRM